MNIEYIIIGVIAVVIVAFVVYAIVSTNKIKKNGIEAEAVVSQIRVEVTNTVHDDTGFVDTDRNETVYVRYKTQDGKEVEAMLQNTRMRMKEGDTVKIKYLPENPGRALMVK